MFNSSVALKRQTRLVIESLENRCIPATLVFQCNGQPYTDVYNQAMSGRYVRTAYYMTNDGVSREVSLDRISVVSDLSAAFRARLASPGYVPITYANASPGNLTFTVGDYEAVAEDNPAIPEGVGGKLDIQVAGLPAAPNGSSYRWIQLITTTNLRRNGGAYQTTPGTELDTGYPRSPYMFLDEPDFYDKSMRPDVTDNVTWNGEAHLALVRGNGPNADQSITVYPDGFTWGWHESTRNDFAMSISGSSSQNPTTLGNLPP